MYRWNFTIQLLPYYLQNILPAGKRTLICFLVDACDTVKTPAMPVVKMWDPQVHKLQTGNIRVVNTETLAVTVRSCSTWAYITVSQLLLLYLYNLLMWLFGLNISLCKQALFQHVVPNCTVLLGVLRRVCFSESPHLILKSQNQSVSPLMTGAHLALSWLALKVRKELGLPQWEVGNWSFEVLYVFLLMSSNSLMFVYI